MQGDGCPSYSNRLLCPHVLLNEVHEFGMLALISGKPLFPGYTNIAFLWGLWIGPDFGWHVGSCLHQGLHYTTQQWRQCMDI